MKTVIITEKPSVAQDYKNVLKVKASGKTDGYIEGYSSVINKDVIITWAVGHLVSIATPEEQNEEWKGWSAQNLPMIPTKYKYVPLPNTRKQFNVIKSIYTRPDIERIYYAGDSAREGIYIQALIRNQIFKTDPKCDERVVWLDSTTEEEILKGIKNAKPYSSYSNMIDSGYMRAISDWLIGMNFTEAFSIAYNCGMHNTINVGRVMTPTLAMIVHRQEEIDNFVKTDYFGIKAADFASWKAVKGTRYFESSLLYNDNGFKSKDDAENLLNEFNKSQMLTVSDVKSQTKTEYAPFLYNLADIQATCSKRFHITPAQSLAIVQKLYEDKYTTYPRTDSRFLSSAIAEELRGKGYNIPSRYVNDKKVQDHYAIIPTFQGDANKLNGLDRKVYDLIAKRFLDTMKPPYIYDAISVVYTHQNGEKFFEAFRRVKQLGFKENEEQDANHDEDEKKDDNEKEKVIDKETPKVGSFVTVNEFKINSMESKPPVAYTTGTIILAMEKAGKLIEDEELREQIKTSGIGTSATRAGIIEKLEKKNFIFIDKKQKISPTDYGKAVIPRIEKYDATLISPVKTAEMEEKLSAIANGEMSRDEYTEVINSYVRNTVKEVLSSDKSNESQLPSLEQSGGNGGKSGSGTGEIIGPCPRCGKNIVESMKAYGCEDKNCGFILWKDNKFFKNAKKTFTKTMASSLINKGKVNVKGLYSQKTGKTYDATILLDDTGTYVNFKLDFSQNTGKNSSQKEVKKTSGWTSNSSGGWGTKKK